MTNKPPPHPPRQAKHPGRGQIAPHRRKITFEQEHHARAMRRPNEPVETARHSLLPHTPHKDPTP